VRSTGAGGPVQCAGPLPVASPLGIMDLLLAICQGLGLAIAAGLIFGVVLPPIMPTWGAIAGVAPLGILACAAALNGADEALWPALPVGLLGGALAASVSRDVAAGAARRERGATTDVNMRTPSGVMTIIVVTAAAVAVLSLVVPPVSLVAAFALAWLAISRRQREERKHEGLRVLR
jgi:hypothetical protein